MRTRSPISVFTAAWLGCIIVSRSLSAQTVPISEIQHHSLKSKYDGRTVTTTGIVTYPTGIMNQSVFYIQNGEYGIRCYNISPKLKIGDSVKVTGKVVEYVAETEIIIDDTTQFKSFGQRHIIAPKFQRIADLHKNEFAEGTLVRTVGRVENNSQSLFTISDGDAQLKIMLPGTFLDVLKGIQVGDTISAVGVLGRNETYPATLNVRFPYELFHTTYRNIVTARYAYQDNNGDFVPDLIGSVQTLTGIISASIELPSGGQLIHFNDRTKGSAIFNPKEGELPRVGDSIIVSGVIGSKSGFEQMIPNNLDIISSGNKIIKRIVKIVQLLDENNQGFYVTVSGQIRAKYLSRDDSFFRLFDETGEIEVYIPAHLNNDGTVLEFNENEFVTVSGVANQYDNSPPFNDHYQLKIVRLDDIERSETVSSEFYRQIFIVLIVLIIAVAVAFVIIFLLRRQIKIKTNQIQKRAQYLDFENQLSKGLNRNLAVNDVLSFTANSLKSLLDFDIICFGILDRKSKRLSFKVFGSAENQLELRSETFSDQQDSFVETIINSDDPFYIKLNEPNISLPVNSEYNHWLCFSIKDASRSTGLVIIASRNGISADPDILETIKRISNHFAIGLRNSQLFDELQAAYHELKNAQSQLVQNEKMKAIGQLASGMAHDFNNILSIIMGLTQVMLKNDQSDENQKKLNSILKASADGADIISRIQEFSRLNIKSEWESLDLNEILNDVIALTQSGWKNKKDVEGIKINILTRYSQIPYVLGHLSELRTVFTNILFNAMDAMTKSGNISITTWFDSNRIKVSIEDTGSGMNQETREKIFEPFFTTKGIKGNGLGMSQVYGIIQRHKGEISVESEVNKGTKITISLLPGSETKSIIAPDNLLKSKPGKHILIVEDEEEIRHILEDILEAQGYLIQSYETAEEAIRAFDQTAFDLICSDLGLPGMSGWDFVRYIRNVDAKIPIMLVTGWGNEINQTKLEEFGVNGLISKPFKIENIVNKVYDLLEND